MAVMAKPGKKASVATNQAPRLRAFLREALENSQFQTPIAPNAPELGMIYFSQMERGEQDMSTPFFAWADTIFGSFIATVYVPDNERIHPSTYLRAYEQLDEEGNGVGAQGRNAFRVSAIATFPELAATDKFEAKPAAYTRLELSLSWIGDSIARAWRSNEVEMIDHEAWGVTPVTREESEETSDDVDVFSQGWNG